MNIVVKETLDIVTDRSFLLSLVIQFLLISTLLFIYESYSSVSQLPVTVHVSLEQPNPTLEEKLREQGVVVHVKNSSEEKIPLPVSSPAAITQPQNTTVVARIDTESKTVETESTIMSTFAISKIRQATEELTFDEALMQKNFTFAAVQQQEHVSELVQLAYGMLLPIAALLPALIAMSLTTQNVFVERKRKTIELLLVSPISDFYLLFYKLLPHVTIATICATLWLLLISTRIPLFNFPLLVFLSLLFTVFLTSCAMVVSCYARSVKEADGISSLIGMSLMISLVLPHLPFSVYLPTVVMARAGSTLIDQEIVWGVLLFCGVCGSMVLIALRSIARLRTNYQ